MPIYYTCRWWLRPVTECITGISHKNVNHIRYLILVTTLVNLILIQTVAQLTLKGLQRRKASLWAFLFPSVDVPVGHHSFASRQRGCGRGKKTSWWAADSEREIDRNEGWQDEEFVTETVYQSKRWTSAPNTDALGINYEFNIAQMLSSPFYQFIHFSPCRVDLLSLCAPCVWWPGKWCWN